MATIAERQDQQASELASSLDCLTEPELCQLAQITPLTAASWRKRGTGPAYVLLGNTFLYPRQELGQFLSRKLRRGGSVEPKSAL